MTAAKHGPHSGVGFSASVVNAQRFWIRVSIGAGCWEWIGRKHCGYGVYSVSKLNRPVPAHRVSFALSHGAVPAGLVVRHSCDNKGCVNPAHLLIGTTMDNVHDALERKRMPHQKDRLCRRGHILKAGSGMCAVCRAANRARQLVRVVHAKRERGAHIFAAYFNQHIAPKCPRTLSEVVSRTDLRSATVFASWFGLYGLPATEYGAIAATMGVSSQRVQQLRDKVLHEIGVAREVISMMPRYRGWKQLSKQQTVLAS